MKSYLYFSCTIILMFLYACKGKSKESGESVETYFSTNQFLEDQWEMLKVQPYNLHQFTTIDNKTDSIIVSLDSVVWKHIYDVFKDADISNPKFLDLYNFQYTDDLDNGIYNLQYTAKASDQYTQKLIVSVDNIYEKIKYIYIETLSDGFLKYKSQKLSFNVGRSVLIQEFEKPLFFKPKEVKVLYKFF